MSIDYKEDLDFEIQFFEDLLKKKHDFVEALVALGDAYTKKGRFSDGLKIDLKLLKLRHEDPIVHYNLACDYSLLEKADISLRYLESSFKLGYDEFTFIEKDTDLDFIRKDPRYKKLILRFLKNKKKINLK